MKINFIILLFLLAAYNSFGQTSIIKFDRLDALIKEKGDKINVINFWATWCGPCVKELPYFEAIRNKYDDKIQVSLISLDFAEKIDKVDQFVARKGLRSAIYLLDEIDYNSWIDKVDERWTGAIPATLIINQSTGERKFIGHELEDGELDSLINEFIN